MRIMAKKATKRWIDSETDPASLATMNERLRWARARAGHSEAGEAADALKMPRPTYWGHENGHRGFPKESAIRYAKFYRVDLNWLLSGRGRPRQGTLGQQIDQLDTSLQGEISSYLEYLIAKKRTPSP